MESLLAADSFRVRMYRGRAEVRGLTRHLTRFADTVRAAAFDSDAPVTGLQGFLEDSLREIAEFGEGFPRLEFSRSGTFSLRLRDLPELRNTLAMRTIDSAAITDQDPPSNPTRKGPNIESYAALNRRLGSEALLVDEFGSVLEGATTSVLWWAGNELSVVAGSRRVPSVTESLLREIAARRGAILRECNVTPAPLRSHEVWAVNALHGIRPVESIDGIGLPEAQTARLAAFRNELDRTWEPIMGDPGLAATIAEAASTRD